MSAKLSAKLLQFNAPSTKRWYNRHILFLFPIYLGGIILYGMLLPAFLAAIDIISIIFVAFAALYLRFDDILPEFYAQTLIQQLPALIFIRLLFDFN